MSVSMREMLEAGVHFGHQTRFWNPGMAPHIFGHRNKIHIINLESTIQAIEKAGDFIKKIVKNNGEILFVGTKKQAQDIIQQEADRCSMFYIVERWLGGTLTNFATIKKSIKRLKMLEKEGSNLYNNMTKKETQMLNRERIKLADQHRGIKDMKRLPDALVIVDAQYEDTAIKEAKRLDIPVVAIVDSNTNPHKVEYPIPANDDSMRTIQLIISSLADSVLEAKTVTSKENMQEIDTNSPKNSEPSNFIEDKSKEEE